ncbi:alpha/beta hydrolase [Nonomuraea rhodomycinica]|uniref:Alpha/beta fold hydrolase n=1 Tax=Nonomuraea rhodomycinica TaxID=1712872 RepID=A0A7Y6IMT9_9ACTN|nr:alpha/beta hydrolase [Nonomuraea rhodomycinica]NUW40643.1 alpha/beta fold hydrolase [Nonomuraea rhodomycinica]
MRRVKRCVRVVAAVATLAGGMVSAGGSPAAAGAPAPASASPGTTAGTAAGASARSGIAWAACPAGDRTAAPGQATPSRAARVECGAVRVPVDHSVPLGQSLTIAVNRIPATVPRDGGRYLGTMLVNPGGPGGSGRKLAEFVAGALPAELAGRYDIVGFDPRGVGGSRPAMHCVDPRTYYAAPRPDAVPGDAAEEQVLLGRAQEYANRCAALWPWLLPHMTTADSARDMDRVRAALGEEKITYLGYSYGTYLGAVYATLFPQRVRRLVLDSSVDPGAVWYRANLNQDVAFDRRHRDFLAWVARHNDVYRLGRTEEQTSFAWYAMRARLREHPAGGVVGPSELDDVFSAGGYSDRLWPQLASLWSRYVRQGEVSGLLDGYDRLGGHTTEDENGYAVYLSVQCADAPWPRDWAAWHADMAPLHLSAPFLTWPNAWYNAPCAFWPQPGGKPVDVRGGAGLPPILMIQSRGDAATPYQGALNLLRRLPTARMVVEGGGNHGVALSGNACVDRHLTAYLSEGKVPRRTAVCPAMPEPRAVDRMAAPRSHGQESLTRALSG